MEKRNFKQHKLIVFALIAIIGCQQKKSPVSPLFERLTAAETKISFSNDISYSRDFNVLNYTNFYNGGGVGIGDVNNDGLQDIYLTANQKANQLYLNKGNFEFENITKHARVAGNKKWSTGVSMADVNGDGHLDIYVCNAGKYSPKDRRNELFINKGDGQFVERGHEFGLDDPGFTTHASFFDYDNDGDLDVYIVNNSHNRREDISENRRDRTQRMELGGDRLLRNDDGKFTDVTEKSGIYSSVIGYGLGVSVSDLDKDGWQDIFISNDFFERDYLYMNNGDGTFREVYTKLIRSGSVASMGADIADFTADGYPEIFVTEMLHEDEKRLKTNMDFTSWDDYQFYLNDGYYHQFSRNVLQHNKGVIPGQGIAFSEVSRMEGVEATDWSWAATIFDSDNDGFKDLFIANGYFRDILNKDYSNYMANPRREFFVQKGDKVQVDLKKVIDKMPSNPIANYAYKGGPDLSFTKMTTEWGLNEPSFSNGSAYGDLDNDGDLDLIINNVNMPVFVYRNRSQQIYPNRNYLKVDLKGTARNTAAIGAKVTLKANGRLFYQEQVPNRGFQSSVDNRLNFGLGDVERIDSLVVDWPGRKQTIKTNVSVNQTILLHEANALRSEANMVQDKTQPAPFFIDITDRYGLTYLHTENEFNDFNRNPLLFHMQSTEGPLASRGDVNGDGRSDIFIGGAKGSPSQLFVQNKDGSFQSTNQALFIDDKSSEDLGSLFFDADQDGDLDLYVTSGGMEVLARSPSYQDRLYINGGHGNFTKSSQSLPTKLAESTSVVKGADIDSDGDIDLFVGVRLRPGLLGIPQNGYLLENDGQGNFKNVSRQAGPDLSGIGMITGAAWSDYDGDGDNDLLVVGRWMSIKLFKNNGEGIFSEQTNAAGLSGTKGWWNTIEPGDIDGDGDTDFIVGNLGLNSRFKASHEKPMHYYIGDFDQNGSFEKIITVYNGDNAYPFISRDEIVNQLPYLKVKYPTNASYAGQTMQDIFTQSELEQAITHSITMFESVILRNTGSGSFQVEPLPKEAQVSPIYAILISDLDGDNNKDVLLGGNQLGVKPQIGIYNSSYGTYLKGTDEGVLQAVENRHSGLALEGEIRDFIFLQEGAKSEILVIKNNETITVLKVEDEN